MPAWAWLAAGIFYACVILLVLGLCRAAAIGDQQAERAHAEHKRRQAEAARPHEATSTTLLR
jgi:hypothetical protein